MDMTFQIEQRDGWEHVSLVGPINEDSDVPFATMQQKLGKSVIFNFRQVSYVNSCGVRAWINFLRDVEDGRKIIFEECTPEIISQINMIPNFKGGSHIRSLYAGYICPECEHQQWHLFEEGKNLPSDPQQQIEAVACESCGAEMEMEELEDEFFEWLTAS